jgi:serralysin
MIAAFQDDIDTLVLDDALWGGGHISAKQLMDRYAIERGHDVLLDFGHGSVLRIRDLARADALMDDTLCLS